VGYCSVFTGKEIRQVYYAELRIADNFFTLAGFLPKERIPIDLQTYLQPVKVEQSLFHKIL